MNVSYVHWILHKKILFIDFKSKLIICSGSIAYKITTTSRLFELEHKFRSNINATIETIEDRIMLVYCLKCNDYHVKCSSKIRCGQFHMIYEHGTRPMTYDLRYKKSYNTNIRDTTLLSSAIIHYS